MYKTATIHSENCLVRVFAVWGVVVISTFWLNLDISTTLHTAAAHVGLFPPTHENADLTMATEAPPAMSHDAPTKNNPSPRQSKKRRISDESEEAIGVANGEETTPEIEKNDGVVTVDEVFAHEFSADISQAERQAIVKEYNRVMGRIFRNSHPLDEEVGLAEIEKTIRELKPKEDIICLYVRFARQLPSNFHIDSMATVLCVAKQCNYSPYKFLNDVQTLLVCHSTCGYKLSFWFKPGKNEKQIENKFVGLSLTLKLLEATISKSCANLGKVGMRQKAARAPMDVQVPLGNKQSLYSKLKSPIEFHKQKSLQARLWQGINHRWLAFALVELLFKHDEFYSWTVKECFIFSIQIFAPCGPSRYDFLDPLAGFCMRFTNQVEINANRNSLQKIWELPSSFMQNGNVFLREKSIASKTKLIVACFNDLKELLHRKTQYNRWLPFNTRLQILRAYTFHFWLEQSANSGIKKAVLGAISPETQHSTSRKAVPSTITADGTKHNLDPPPKSKKPRSLTKVNGMDSLMNSRQLLSPAVQPNHNKDREVPTAHLQVQQHYDPLRDRKVSTWKSLRLMSREELDLLVASYLIIKTDRCIDILAKLSPFEVYSADRLRDYPHSRLYGKPDYIPTEKVGEVVLHVGTKTNEFIGTNGLNMFHVVRDGSSFFKEHGHVLPTIEDCAMLCHAVTQFGSIDDKRSPQQYRVFIGNGGQNRPNGVPATLVDNGFEKRLRSDPEIDADQILLSIGRLTEFVWNVMVDMQREACDSPLAPDSTRHKSYARHLSAHLGMNEMVAFEDITIVVSVIHPHHTNLNEHKDVMNDNISGYTRTGCLNMCFRFNDGVAIHFQLITNFRKVIGQYMIPFSRGLQSTIRHAHEYLNKYRWSMESIYGGRSTQIPKPFSRKHFYLDDDLPYQSVVIFDGSKKGKANIIGEYLLASIGPSRVLSMSMFIDPIRHAQRLLKFDQCIELAFMASLLNNPFWFDYVMTSLLERHEDPNSDFQFGIHPFFDWSRTTIETFGAWQGGPYNRWSPCGGEKSILEVFGAGLDSTLLEKEKGTHLLEGVLEVLIDHLQWVDGLADQSYADVSVDLPLSLVQKHMEEVREKIAAVAKCQFSLFRLGIFTTIVTGTGLLRPGRHLKNLMYPVRGAASFRHLTFPSADVMSEENAVAIAEGDSGTRSIHINNSKDCIDVGYHDRAMVYLSAAVGCEQYVRDEMECLLCESHPSRNLTQCRDWFKRGQNIYDCTSEGVVVERSFGSKTEWKVVEPFCARYPLAFLQQRILYVSKDKQLAETSRKLGTELRDPSANKWIRWDGRTSATSRAIQQYDNGLFQPAVGLSHHRHKVAHVYDGRFALSTDVQSMMILGNGMTAQLLNVKCSNAENSVRFMELLDYLNATFSSQTTNGVMRAASYHQGELNNNSTPTFFPFHFDKVFARTVWFVPISDHLFFTLVAVPSSWQITQHVQSYSLFDEWMSTITCADKHTIEVFMESMKRYASSTMKESRLLVYACNAGSYLSFPASTCLHATITPGLTAGNESQSMCRDLLIIHPLELV
jgi:hypothetical protein